LGFWVKNGLGFTTEAGFYGGDDGTGAGLAGNSGTAELPAYKKEPEKQILQTT
jgi:hypothetical protein